MRTHRNKKGPILPAAMALFGAAHSVFAHGIDERPGLGADLTLILSVFWILVAIGIVYFIRRLIRSDLTKKSHRKDAGRGEEKEDPR